MGWKRQLLSKGGRSTLIKNTLANLPTYCMSLFTIPTFVAKRLEKMERDFLWEGSMEEQKYHLVDKDKLCSSVREGGLGVKILGCLTERCWVSGCGGF